MTMCITAVDLKNIFLSSPLTKDGRLYMFKTHMNQNATISDFLEKCYVEPTFTRYDSFEELTNNEPELSIDKYQDYEFAKYVYEIGQRSDAFRKEEFEKSLLGADINNTESKVCGTVFLIEGPAGCGKTTYARKLLSQKFEIDLYDIDTATQKSCRFFGEPYNSPNKGGFNPIDALEISLLSGIHNRLANKNEREDDYRNRLKQLCSIYDKIFYSELISTIDDEEYRNFFSVIHDYANNKHDYSQLTGILHKQIKNVFEDHQSSSNSMIPSIKFLLGILMRFHICSSQIDNKKTIIFLDNFEKFIFSENGKPYMHINDSHLQKIICSIYSVSDETQDLVIKIFEGLEIDKSEYFTSFGILIAMREFTLKQLTKNITFMNFFENHHAERMPTYVNITDWFDYRQVFKKKVKFFTGLDVENDPEINDIIHTFDIILSDNSRSKWCLRNLFIDIFNHNFRLFFGNLTEAFFCYHDTMKFFKKNWDAASDKKDYYKHLCRKLILRLVLDHMQNNNIGVSKKYFAHLLAIREINVSEKEKEKSTYTRRILTYLDNKYKEQILSDKNDKEKMLPDKAMISFPDLTKTLLHKPILSIDNNSVEKISNINSEDSRFDDIAKILTIAGEASKIEKNGVELVTLTLETDTDKDMDIFEDKNEILAKEMKLEWKNYINNSMDFQEKGNVKISPSGSVFAMLFPCFEYFACRYRPDLIPLLMMKKEKDREDLLYGHKEKGADGIERHIAGIVEYAISCVDYVVDYEEKFLSMGGVNKLAYPEWLYKQSTADKGIVHPIRIICEHTNYLQAYKNFLLNYADDEYEKGTEVVDKAIDEYTKKLEEIISQHQSYVELGMIPKFND